MYKYAIILLLFLGASDCIGQQWEEVETPLNYVTDIQGHRGQLVIVGTGAGQMYYATSANGGISWDTVNITDASEVDGSPIYVGFFNEQEGTIGIKGSFTKDYLQTSDGGETWTAATFELDTSCNNLLQPYGFYRVNDQVGLVNGFQSGRYMLTSDGGSSWSCSPDFGTSWVPQIYVANDTVWYTKDSDGFYITHDAGNNWELAIDKEFIHFQCMGDEIVGLSIYYNESDGIPALYRTNNEWETYDSIPLTEFSDVFLTMFVQANNGGVYLLEGDDVFYSASGTSDFTLIQTLEDEPFRSVYIENAWYLTGRGLAKLNDPVISSIDDEPTLESLDVYPNPASEYLEIRLPSTIDRAQLKLFDVAGVEVLRTVLDSKNSVDVSNLTEGIYFYNLRTYDSVLRSGKVVIMR